jgi:dihydroneopterin triphosphate diphosphatase
MTHEAKEVLIHVRRGDEFLVAHRAPDSGSYWHTIAGGVEADEEWEAAAIRELREETTLDVSELRPIGSFSYVREAWEESAGLRVSVQAFVVDVEPGWEPTLDHEHDDYRWCEPAAAFALLHWADTSAALRRLLAVAP